MQYLALLLVIGTLVAATLVGLARVRSAGRISVRPGGGDAAAIAIEVPRGASFPQVLTQLVEAGVVPADEALYFKLFVLHRGAASKVTAGEHSFRGDMTPEEILAELVRAQRAEELGSRSPRAATSSRSPTSSAGAGFGSAAGDPRGDARPALLEELGIDGPSVEGYLFPDTYKFQTKATPSRSCGAWSSSTARSTPASTQPPRGDRGAQKRWAGATARS
jgi:UPF0755 protein